MFEPGDLIADRFRVTALLGQGGFGATYAAHDMQSNQLVAVKALALEHVDDWKTVELFEREAKILESLDHPQIPDYIDFIQTPETGEGFIAQTLAPGKSLEAWVRDGRRFAESECLDIARQVLGILDYLAGLRPAVVHRDIKPANLIMDDGGAIRLVDFGAVRVLAATTQHGSTLVGTLGFMAPEQLQGEATTVSDIYGLGMTLVFLLTGQDPTSLPKKRLKVDYKSFVQVAPAFEYVLDLMLETIPEDRVESAAQALQLLGDVSALMASSGQPTHDEIDALVQNKMKAQARQKALEERATVEHRATVAKQKRDLQGHTQIQTGPEGVLISYAPNLVHRLTFARAAAVFGGGLSGVFFIAVIVIGIWFQWNLAVLINVGIWSTVFAVGSLVVAYHGAAAANRERIHVRVNPSGNFMVFRNERRPIAFGAKDRLSIRAQPAGPDRIHGEVTIGIHDDWLHFKRLSDQDVSQFLKFVDLAGLG